MMNYRESMLKAVGFDKFPTDTDSFLKMMKALKEKGTPGGFALGHATGDANTWCHWLVWAFGGKLVDTSNKVDHRQPRDGQGARIREASSTRRSSPARCRGSTRPTTRPSSTARSASPTTASRSTTRRRTSQDPKIKELAADINHAVYPIGPVGVVDGVSVSS